MKLKDGHTYITRSGVKRKVSYHDMGIGFPFRCKSLCCDGYSDTHTESGRFLTNERKHKWDFVKEYKKCSKK